MDILIIGGTKFVGRALVEATLANGHNVTLFNRGRTAPDAFPQVKHVVGDRDGNLDALGDQKWDAVIDTPGYVPRVVRQSVEYLKERVDRYVFISTISVYASSNAANRDETADLADFPDDVDPNDEQITGASYGPLKVACEREILSAMPDQTLIIRPGLIVGPHDPTNRFTYWPTRIRSGGAVLAPGKPDYPSQFIDVRDLGEWTIRMVEQEATGIYNATGPAQPYTLAGVFETCRDVTGADAEFVWADDELLLENEVAPYSDLPLWVPGEMVTGFNTISVQKAVDAGLTFRPLEQTVRDTLAWVDDLDGDPPGNAGISAAREAELLTLAASQQ